MSGIWNGLQEIIGATLSFFYGLIPNFGVAIVLLTVAIGVLLSPLTLKQVRSMKAMQEIQPEIKRLQKELKHDRQAQQAAMMELYRERGVNPAAGCLPLLLQMPIWFALFSVLRAFGSTDVTKQLKWVTSGSDLEAAIEAGNRLRFAWMDLSLSPSDAWSIGILDALPYLITIVLVMITAYWQQRQTQARTQQQQGQQQPGQAVMKIFPLFFGFISFTLPAGLVVYFAASQIFRVGQQALFLRLDARRADVPTKERREQEREQRSQPERDTPGAPSPSDRPRRNPQASKKRGKKRRRR